MVKSRTLKLFRSYICLSTHSIHLHLHNLKPILLKQGSSVMIIQKQKIICRILSKLVKDSYEFNRRNFLFCLLFLTTTSRFCVSVVYGELLFVLEMCHIELILQIWIRYCVQVTSTTMHSCLT